MGAAKDSVGLLRSETTTNEAEKKNDPQKKLKARGCRSKRKIGYFKEARNLFNLG
jgi:hypothetical protein